MRIILILATGLLLSGCGGNEPRADSGIDVVAGFYPLAFAAERMGDGVTVTNLTPPGSEPHDTELTADDVERVIDADVVVYVGRGFQPALEDAAEQAVGTAVDVLETVESIDDDPHVWLDPVRYAQIVRRIGDALDRPEAAEKLAAELEALDRELALGLADCKRRAFVTSHAAFAYLAARYDLEQIPITGLSPEAEPRPGELADVVRRVKDSGATTVFFETLVSPRLAETVARETGAEVAALNPIEGLTDAERSAGEDYFSLMRENLAALRKALACR